MCQVNVMLIGAKMINEIVGLVLGRCVGNDFVIAQLHCFGMFMCSGCQMLDGRYTNAHVVV